MSSSGVHEERDQVIKYCHRIQSKILTSDRFSCHCNQVLSEGSSRAGGHVEVNLHLSNITIQNSHGLDYKSRSPGYFPFKFLRPNINRYLLHQTTEMKS